MNELLQMTLGDVAKYSKVTTETFPVLFPIMSTTQQKLNTFKCHWRAGEHTLKPKLYPLKLQTQYGY